MSVTREVGKLVLWGGFLYLIVQGCIVIKAARTIAVLTTLLGHLLGSCGGSMRHDGIKQASSFEVVQDDVHQE